jgi:hypothetical protein
LRQPTITPSGRRTPGLKLDDPRLLAVMQALTCFIHLARGGRFRTRDLHQRAAEALGVTTATYRLGQLRYDLVKLRAKGLVLKVPKTQTYRLTPQGLRICVLFLKLSQRVYGPLAAALLEPVPHDALLSDDRRSNLDHLYAAVDRALSISYSPISDSNSLPERMRNPSTTQVPKNAYLRHITSRINGYTPSGTPPRRRGPLTGQVGLPCADGRRVEPALR